MPDATPKYAGRSLEVPAPAPSPAPLPPADTQTAYDAGHASEVSVAAGHSAAEGIVKTAAYAETLAATGVTSVADVPGNLAANANAASANVVNGAPIVAGPVSGSGGTVASIHDSLNSGPGRAKRPRGMYGWLPLVLGGLAIGGMIYVVSQSGSRRSRDRSE